MYETNELNNLNGKIEERIRGDIKQDKGVSAVRIYICNSLSYKRRRILMATI